MGNAGVTDLRYLHHISTYGEPHEHTNMTNNK